ncbi:DUF1289 domain-containing protein [Sphingomonas sp. MMS24-JH45]
MLVCTMDKGLCLGCHHTLGKKIAGWSAASDEEAGDPGAGGGAGRGLIGSATDGAAACATSSARRRNVRHSMRLTQYLRHPGLVPGSAIRKSAG